MSGATLRTRRVLLALTSLALSGAALTGCGEAGTSAAGGEQGFVAGDGSVVVLAEPDRKSTAEFEGPTLEGGTWSLSEHKGKLVVMNVWASWCAPCRAEAPALAKVADELQPKVAFVGLNTRDSDASAKAFVSRFDLGYPNVVDPDGVRQLLFRDTLPPQAIPSTVVFDREGRVAARALGKVSAAELRTMIESVDKGFGSAGGSP